MKVFAAVSLAALLGASAQAQDGAALFKSKCVACHNTKGQGRTSMKGTNLLSDEAKKKTDDELTDQILNGGPSKKASHAFGKKGVTPDQAKAIVAYIRTLQQ
ncbi:MAG: c-type cytochrome [Acidobacteriota bacterium]